MPLISMPFHSMPLLSIPADRRQSARRRVGLCTPCALPDGSAAAAVLESHLGH
jgi:hypothetical protein